VKINVSEFKKICYFFIKDIQKKGFERIPISIDWYWTYQYEQAYRIKSIPLLTPAIGSISDDWEWLEKVLKKKNPLTSLDVERLANIVQVIGDTIYAHVQQGSPDPVVTIDTKNIKRLLVRIFAKINRYKTEQIEVNETNYLYFSINDIYNF